MFLKQLTALPAALITVLALFAATSMAQTTLHVGPGQTYTTIQSGIDAANAGDTVLVAPGTYYENIDFKGKAITVTSSGGATVTTIDGGNKGGLATVLFSGGETSASVISGFTIRGGGDDIFSGTSYGGIEVRGDSAYVAGPSPTIQNNIITANYCHNINVRFASPTILNNEISGTLQNSQGTGLQASYCGPNDAIFLGGTSNFQIGGSIVIGNTIENNLAGGSAIHVYAAVHVLVMNNVIRNNYARSTGSAFMSENAGDSVVVQNLIYRNTSTCGGALSFNGGILIANNTIVDNLYVDLFSGSECTPIAQIYPDNYSYGDSFPNRIIINNIISGSTSYPAVNCDWFGPPSESFQPTFQNNILHNAGGPFFGSYCVDVSGKYNNIVSDPQFVSPSTGDYHLKSTSPAIDSGQNSVLQTFKTMTGMDLTTDFDGKPRVQDATAKGCIIDMGAYEVPGTLSSCGVSETLTSSLNPAMAGQSVTFTAQLTAASGTPTGAVQFLDGATLLSTQTVSGSGSAAFTTSSLTIGSHTITANYQPTGIFGASTASLTQVINGDTTSTALTCVPNPINIAGTAQLTATVTSTFGTPTGAIAFSDNGTALATQGLLAGTTSYNYTGSIAATHTITATYAPTGNFAASSAKCSEVVNPLPSTSTLVVAPAMSTYGTPVTLTATVSPATQPGPSTPTGIVTFYNGATTIGTGTLAGGVATISPVSLPGGSYNLTCTYSGSSIYASSSCNPAPIVVNAVPTALTVISSINPATYLNIISFTAHLTSSGQSAGTGNIIQLNINGQIANFTTDATGTATYAIATLPPNSYPVTASFAGNNNFLASSAALTQVVIAAPTSISLTGSPNPGDLNQPVTFTATVSSPPTSTPVPTGTVTFYDGSNSIGSSQLSAAGTASLSSTFTTVAIHNITAQFAGNMDFTASTSTTFQESIVAGDFSIAVAPGTAAFYTGESANAQVKVNSLQGFNQPLTFLCYGLPANATCTFSPASLPQGQGTANLVIQTAAPHQVQSAGFVSGIGTMLAALTLLLLPRRSRRRAFLGRLFAVLLALGVAIGISGCGSVIPITGGTPPGTYQVAVTATTTAPGPTLAHSAVVTLTVKSLF
jgi:hypothetical protein